MALTIQQIQANITNKTDQREIINQLADYIEANLIVTPIKVYNASLTQTGTQPPTATIQGTQTIDFGTWNRFSEGSYYTDSTEPYDATKIQIGGFAIGGTAVVFQPISDLSSITGYYSIEVANISNKLRLILESFDNTITYKDFGTLLGTNGRIFLPEIRLY